MRLLIPAALAAALMTLPMSGTAAPQEAAPAVVAATDAQQVAVQLLDRLDAGDYPAIEASFTDLMREQVPTPQLREVWESLPQQLGAATGRGNPELVEQGGYQVVMIPLLYEGGVILAQTAVDAEGKVAGFLLQPAQQAPAAEAAPGS